MTDVITWVNGKLENAVSVMDRGLAYGHGLFETIPFISQKLVLLDWHLERLIKDAQRLFLPISLDKIRENLQKTVFAEKRPDGIVKIIITAGENQRGYAWPNPLMPTYIVIYSPISSEHPMGLQQEGARLCLSHVRLSQQPLLAGMKHLNRLEQVLIRKQVENAGCDDAMVLDMENHVIEAGSANLFLVKTDQVYTPALEKSGIAGVMRRYILEKLCPLLNISLQIKALTLDDFHQADEVFMTNSAIAIVPVVSLEKHVWPIGQVTRLLQITWQQHKGQNL